MRPLAGFILLAVAAIATAQPPDPPPPVVKIPATEASLALRHKDLIPNLIESLKDLDSDVRQHSAMALASLGPVAIKPLTDALTDSIKDKRAAAAYALGQMGYDARDAIPSLLKVLKDDEAVVRRSASQAISRILSSDVSAAGFSVKPLPILPPASEFGSPRASRPPASDPVPAASDKSEPKPEKPQ